MIKIENAEWAGFEAAIRGMRNPLNSWAKSDSIAGYGDNGADVIIGASDLALMHRLRNAGTDHRKFMRMICVWCDITAPFYWWKEFDTYKVGTVANSCSTMHKIHDKEFSVDDFSCEHLGDAGLGLLEAIVWFLNSCRDAYNSRNFTCDWWQMIQILPTSYNQKRTVMLNYEVLANIYRARKYHKLDEWVEFCEWIKTLPYFEIITGKDDAEDE